MGGAVECCGTDLTRAPQPSFRAPNRHRALVFLYHEQGSPGAKLKSDCCVCK